MSVWGLLRRLTSGIVIVPVLFATAADTMRIAAEPLDMVIDPEGGAMTIDSDVRTMRIPPTGENV